MANYSKINFCVPAGNDTSLKIRDKNGKMRFTIYNNTETTFIINQTNIIIKNDGDSSDIILDFATVEEATQALIILNTQYSTVRANYNQKKKNDLINSIGIGVLKTYIYGNFSGADQPLINNQVFFNVPNAASINMMSINGLAIRFSFNSMTHIITIAPSEVGYNIESTDEVIIKYY